MQLGRIRALTDDGGGGLRVDRAETERLRAGPGFPEALRRSVQGVGTTEGAALIDVTKTCFTRLARLGLPVPVKFHLNRYHAVARLHPAGEPRLFAADDRNTSLLTGRMPESLGSLLDTGIDLRPRSRRTRQSDFMLRRADDPWARAGAVASLLDPLHVSEAVPDACDRSHLDRFRRRPPSHGVPGSPAAESAEELMTTQDPDEVTWPQAEPTRLTEEVRAPRTASRPVPRRPGSVTREAVEPVRGTPRGLLGRWRRGNR